MAAIRPTTDSERIVSLRTALESALRDQINGQTYLATTSLAELEPLIAQWESATHRIAQATADHRTALAATQEALVSLQAQVRHVWTTVRWRVRWQGASPALLPYYHLPARRTPYPKSRGGWLELAERLLQGDAAAIEAGYPGAADTPALTQARDALATALGELNGAKQRLHLAQQEIKSLRSRSDRAIRHLSGDLRYALRDRSATAQQQIMRTYGVHFQRNSVPSATIPTPLPADSSLSSAAEGTVVGWQLQPEPAAVAQ